MDKTTNLGPWGKGLNNVQPDANMPTDALRTVVNADIMDDGRVRRRVGLTEIESGAVHSLWSDDEIVLYVKAGDLYRLMEDDTSILMRASVTGRTMQYESVNGNVYYANGAFMGMVVGGATREWGVEVPSTPPVVTSNTAAGSVPLGRYQIVATFVNMWGEESAPSHFTVVNTSGTLTIQTPAAMSPEVQSVRVYMTPPDGDVYFRIAEGPAASALTTVISEPRYGMALQTQFLSRVRPGELLCYHAGRIYFAIDNVLYYTEPYNYGLFHPAKNYIQFEARVDMVKSTQTGLYVGAEATFFLEGTDPEKMVQKTVADEPVARYSGYQDPDTTRPLWYGPRGVTMGETNGTIVPLQAENVAVDAPLTGAVARVELNGATQYIAAAVPKRDINQLKAGDYFEAEIERKA